MELLIFRHADKEYSFDADPGLSQKGQTQAEKLKQLLTEKIIPMPTQLWVSPKRRALETFYPLAQVLNLELKIFPELDQRTHEESGREFILRIKKIIEQINYMSQDANIQEAPCLYICTHSDWIEELQSCDPLLSSIDYHNFLMPSGSFIQFQFNSEKKWHFITKRNC